MATREKYIVSLVRPAGVSKTEMKAYIEDAVACMKGCYDPESPIFDLDGSAVKCFSERKQRKEG
jgi:hypothetical protein